MALEGILLDETPNHWSAEREEYLERLARKIRGSEGLVGDRLVSDEFFFIFPDFRAKQARSEGGISSLEIRDTIFLQTMHPDSVATSRYLSLTFLHLHRSFTTLAPLPTTASLLRLLPSPLSSNPHP